MDFQIFIVLLERHIHTHNSHTDSAGIAPFCKRACLQTTQDLQVIDIAFLLKPINLILKVPPKN